MNYRRVFVQNAYVHIIITSYSRIPIFIENIEILRQAIKNVIQIYKFKIIAICILPEHIHIILNPIDIKQYPKIISSIKYSFSRNVGQVCPTYKLKQGYINKREKGVFQRRYYEHTITSQEELNNHIDYIHYNPVKHGYVSKVKDWEYSSFNKFVKNGFYDENWCDFSKIKDINYE